MITMQTITAIGLIYLIGINPGELHYHGRR